MIEDVGTVYLIHINKPYKHCHHYIGWTRLPIEKRLSRHRSGHGACLLKACTEAGISFDVVRTWQNKTFVFEQLLKKAKNAKRFCPVCNPEKFKNYHEEV